MLLDVLLILLLLLSEASNGVYVYCHYLWMRWQFFLSIRISISDTGDFCTGIYSAVILEVFSYLTLFYLLYGLVRG